MYPSMLAALDAFHFCFTFSNYQQSNLCPTHRLAPCLDAPLAYSAVTAHPEFVCHQIQLQWHPSSWHQTRPPPSPSPPNALVLSCCAGLTDLFINAWSKKLYQQTFVVGICDVTFVVPGSLAYQPHLSSVKLACLPAS